MKLNTHAVIALVLACFSSLSMAAPDPVGCDVLASEPLNTSVEFGTDIQPIFTGAGAQAARCTTCHSPNSSGGLSLTVAGALGNLVNVDSTQDVSIKRVVPFDASASLLFRKVNCSTPGVGQRMPLSRPALSANEQRLIRDWINQGALAAQRIWVSGFE